jgi:hypothetical protein
MSKALKRCVKQAKSGAAASPYALDQEELGLMRLLERTIKAAEKSVAGKA